MFKSQFPNPKFQLNPKSQIPNCFKIEFWKTAVCVLAIIFSFTLIPARLVYSQQGNKENEALFVAKKAFEDGFYEVSLGLLERFLKSYPDSPKAGEVNLLIGECYFHQNKFLEALNKFETLLGQPQGKEIQDSLLYWIAEVHFRGNNCSKAQTYYKKIIDEFPKSSYAPSAYYSLGWCLFQDGDFSGALQNFRKVEENFPGETVAQESSFKVIECLYNIKDYSAMKDALKSYSKKYPKDLARIPYLYFYTAEAAYYLNDFNEAISQYLKLLSSTRDLKLLALGKLGVGWSNLKLKHFKEAQDNFNEVAAKDLEKASSDILVLGRAIVLAEDKRFDEAAKLYDELLQSTSDPSIIIQAYLGKADTFYNAAQYKEAIIVYKEAMGKILSGCPEDLTDKLYYGLAWAFLKDGQFKDAIDAFQKVAKESDEKIVKISALCQIGDAYQDSANYPKAIETYDAILKDYPATFYSDYVQYQLGTTLLKTGNYEGAILAFQALKGDYPNSNLLDDASYALGLSYFQRENYTAAQETFEKFQTEFKDSSLTPQAMYLLGTSLYNLGKFNEAIEVYKNIMRTNNQDTELTEKCEYEIADCYYRLGNEKEAMTRFKVLRTKYPDSSLTPEIIWWLGEYYYRRNDSELARRYFASLIQDFPKSELVPNAYYALASTYQEDSQYQQAVDNFKKVIELGKTDLSAQAAIAIADLYVKEDKTDLALATYKEVMKNFANFADLVYPKIADIYQNLGNYDDALFYYRKSLDIAQVKEMPDIQFKIAQVLQAQGKADEAIQEYLKVTYLYSDNNALAVKSLLRVGSIYEDKANPKEAVKIYKRIIAMNVEEGKFAKERIDAIGSGVK